MSDPKEDETSNEENTLQEDSPQEDSFQEDSLSKKTLSDKPVQENENKEEPSENKPGPDETNISQTDSKTSITSTASLKQTNKFSQTSQTSVDTIEQEKPEHVETSNDEQPQTSHDPTSSGQQKMDQFRPHRANDTPVEPAPVDTVPDEEEVELVSSVQQLHKASASAYAMLENNAVIQSDEDVDMDADVEIDMGDADADQDEAERQLEAKHKSSSIQQQRINKFKKFIYNNEDNTYCHRTLSNWCAIFTYYLSIIIIFLAVFLIYIWSFILRDREGSAAIMKYTVMDDPNPALAIVPLDNKKSQLIMWYKSDGSDKNKKSQDYVNDISRLFEDHDLTCHQQKLVKKQCHFDTNDFGPCANESYGYNTNKPCIFLKLNNLITWLPTPILKDTEFPPEISEETVSRIQEEAPRHCVYVDCHGATLYDQTNLGKVDYYPEPAYDIKYFPATKDTKTNPMIALHLNNVKSGRIIQIQCTLLAGNIKDKANSNIKLIVYMD